MFSAVMPFLAKLVASVPALIILTCLNSTFFCLAKLIKFSTIVLGYLYVTNPSASDSTTARSLRFIIPSIFINSIFSLLPLIVFAKYSEPNLPGSSAPKMTGNILIFLSPLLLNRLKSCGLLIYRINHRLHHLLLFFYYVLLLV